MSRGPQPGKRSQWLDRLRRFARTKCSVAEFCRRERVSVASFYQWRRKLTSASPGVAVEKPSSRARFVAVQLTSTPDVQVAFPNGVRLTLPAGDHQLIARTIAAIAQSPTTSGEL